MVEPLEVRIARLEEQFKFLIQDSKEAKETRKQQYLMIEGISNKLTSVSDNVSVVTKTLATQSPTIEEFITIKHKVVAGGKLIKILWFIGGVLIAIVAKSQGYIQTWLGK